PDRTSRSFPTRRSSDLVERAAGPGERSNHQDGGAARIHAARAAQMRGPDQEDHARKAKDKTERHFAYGPVAAGTKPVHNHQPKGDRKSTRLNSSHVSIS